MTTIETKTRERFTFELIDAVMVAIKPGSDGPASMLDEDEKELRKIVKSTITNFVTDFFDGEKEKAGGEKGKVEKDDDSAPEDEKDETSVSVGVTSESEDAPVEKKKVPAKGKKTTNAPAKTSTKVVAKKGKTTPKAKAPKKVQAKAPKSKAKSAKSEDDASPKSGDEIDVRSLTVVQLKEMCKTRKIKFDAKAKKADLVDLIEGTPSDDGELSEELETKPGPAHQPKKLHTVAELKEMCKTKKIKFDAKAKKEDLIVLLHEHEIAKIEAAEKKSAKGKAAVAKKDKVPEKEDLESLTLVQLKEKIDEINAITNDKTDKVSKTGKKAELIERIKAAFSDEGADEPDSETDEE